MADVTRFGERTAHGAASFRCAKCSELAGVVRVARAGTTVDMGPPLGRQTEARDGLVVDYFLGTAWHAADTKQLDAVRAAIDQGSVDPRTLQQIHPELAPFYCPDCQLNYCAKDWDTYVLVDEGFYDCTMGTCPNGHRHTVDDLSANVRVRWPLKARWPTHIHGCNFESHNDYRFAHEQQRRGIRRHPSDLEVQQQRRMAPDFRPAIRRGRSTERL